MIIATGKLPGNCHCKKWSIYKTDTYQSWVIKTGTNQHLKWIIYRTRIEETYVPKNDTLKLVIANHSKF